MNLTTIKGAIVQSTEIRLRFRDKFYFNNRGSLRMKTQYRLEKNKRVGIENAHNTIV